METMNKEFEFKGGYLNGFLMIFIDILLWCATIFCFLEAIVEGEANRSFAPWIIFSALLLIASIICCCGFSMLEPNRLR